MLTTNQVRPAHRAEHKEMSVDDDFETAAVAVSHFIGTEAKGVDLREYKNWYSNQALEALAYAEPTQHSVVRGLLTNDYAIENFSFTAQLLRFFLFQTGVEASFACFMAKEPASFDSSHYIFGAFIGNKTLLLINPTGNATRGLKEVLLVKASLGIENLYLCETKTQKEEKLVSCGPIGIELMRHFSQKFSRSEVRGIESELQALSQETAKGEYKSIDFSKSCFLPASLQALIDEVSPVEYQRKVIAIRQQHLDLIKRGQQGKNEYILINRYLLEGEKFSIFQPLATQEINALKEKLKEKPERSTSILSARSAASALAAGAQVERKRVAFIPSAGSSSLSLTETHDEKDGKLADSSSPLSALPPQGASQVSAFKVASLLGFFDKNPRHPLSVERKDEVIKRGHKNLDEVCGISRESLSTFKDEVTQLLCSHTYAKEEIEKWEKGTCPECRAPFKAQMKLLKGECKSEEELHTYINAAVNKNLAIALKQVMSCYHEKIDILQILKWAKQCILEDKVDSLGVLLQFCKNNINSFFKDNDWALIHYAVVRGSHAALILVITVGAEVNNISVSGDSPLLLAIRALDKDKVKTLIESGADKYQDGSRQLITPPEHKGPKLIYAVYEVSKIFQLKYAGLLDSYFLMLQVENRQCLLGSVLRRDDHFEVYRDIDTHFHAIRSRSRSLFDLFAEHKSTKLELDAEKITVAKALKIVSREVIDVCKEIFCDFKFCSRSLFDELAKTENSIALTAASEAKCESYLQAELSAVEISNLVQATQKINAFRGERLKEIELLINQTKAVYNEEDRVNKTHYPLSMTELHYACKRGDEMQVFHLLKANANPNIKCGQGYTPLMYVAEHKGGQDLGDSLSHLQLFFSFGEEQANAIINELTNDKVLYMRESWHLPRLYKVNEEEFSKKTPDYFEALAQKYTKKAGDGLRLKELLKITQADFVMKLLLEKGASIEEKSSYQLTALEQALANLQSNSCRTLLLLGAAPSVNPSSVRDLSSLGMFLNIYEGVKKLKSSILPLSPILQDLSQILHDWQEIKWPLDDLDAKDSSGQTILFIAIRKRKTTIVKLFLENEASCLICCEEGLYPYDVAKDLNVDHSDDRETCKALEDLLETATLAQLAKLADSEHLDLRERLMKVLQEREFERIELPSDDENEGDEDDDQEMEFESADMEDEGSSYSPGRRRR